MQCKYTLHVTTHRCFSMQSDSNRENSLTISQPRLTTQDLHALGGVRIEVSIGFPYTRRQSYEK